MANLELLNETLMYIKNYPEQWDQGNWVNPCGTAMCFAGHAVILNNPEYRVEHPGLVFNQDVLVGDVEDVARDALDLSDLQGVELFEAENTLEILQNMVNRLTADPNDPLGSGDDCGCDMCTGKVV